MFEEGFKVFDDIFSDEECQAIIDAIPNPSKAGVRNLMSSGHFAELASDPRLLAICREASGRELLPYKATLFNKTGKANWLVAWHQDTALPVECEFEADGWGPFTSKAGIVFGHAPTEVLQKVVALRIHLDASTDLNGPLRVISGSHRRRILSDVDFQRIVRSGNKSELTVGRGGVIAMSPLLIHASSKCTNDEPRRVLHIEYAPSLSIGSDVHLAVA